MPGHRRRVLIVAREAHFAARFGANLSVRIVTRIARESSRSANLVRMCDGLLLSHVGVAAVANVRRNGA